MNNQQHDKLAIVNNKVAEMIDNLQRGNFKIVICDDGKERDVTTDNVKTFQYIQHLLESVISQSNGV